MRRLDLSYEELGSAKLLIYNGNVSDLNNNINHKNILNFKRTTFVDVPLSYFDVSELVPLSDIQKYTLDKYDVLNMLKVSATVVSHCKRQGIELQSVLFDSDYVFVDGKFNTYFLPLKTDKENNNYKDFLKNLIINSIIDPNYKDNFVQIVLNCFNDPKFSIDALIKLINQLTSNSAVDFENTTRPIRKEETTSSPEPSPAFPNDNAHTPVKTSDEEIYPQNKFPNPYQNQAMDNKSFVSKQPQQQVQQTPPQQEQIKQPVVTQNLNQTQYDIYNQNKSTEQQSSQQPQARPKEVYLLSEENQNNKIYVDTDFFAMGRNPEVVNYPINSPYVGRMHAYIKYDNGKYYIIDKNSTNGTYLNNQRLQPEYPQPLKSGDIIRLAKHSFQFNLVY